MDYKLTEPTQISTLLDIENLDVNLYRSKKVILPPGSRGAYILFNGVLLLIRGSAVGVFGGLVISHAMVAATKSVKPEYHLHVRRVTGSKSLSTNPLAQSLHVGFIIRNKARCLSNPSRPVLLHLERVTRLTDIL